MQMSEPRVVRTTEGHYDLFQLFIGRKVMDELIVNPKAVTEFEFKDIVDRWLNKCAAKYREGKYNENN
jgi:hypothetical protein